MAVDSHGMPVRFLVTDATVADCTVAEKLIDNFPAQYLLADRAYDTDAIVEKAIIDENAVIEENAVVGSKNDENKIAVVGREVVIGKGKTVNAGDIIEKNV